nr:uncharacterized protein CTRU02_10690 [Colletotrichum truncatum]KAF6786991.1 hypothetical protein CTRU02_10690 [Colletotrichum truncatum]
MAPYTMTIELKNETDHYIAFVAPSTYSTLGGTTTVQTEGDVQTVKISKSGGTAGLFTALSFVAVNGPDSSKNVQFTVWATMPASNGSVVSVHLIDATTIINGDLNQLRTDEWADKIYQNESWFQPHIQRSGFNISLQKVSTEYPDSTFKLRIQRS